MSPIRLHLWLTQPWLSSGRAALAFVIFVAVLMLGHLGLRLEAGLIMTSGDAASRAGRLASELTLLGLVFVIGIWLLRPHAERLSSGHWLTIMMGAGLVMRLVWLDSPPIFEDDSWRYLWDGAVVAQGLNPYEVPPRAVMVMASDDPMIAAQKAILVSHPDARVVVEKINHPWLATIYPPVAQAFFLAAYYLGPFQPLAWQGLIILVELLSLALICLTLRQMQLPIFLGSIYWLNPLLIEEFVNSMHMDVLLIPFMALACWAVASQRAWLSSLMLVLAAGVKVWPLVLWPALHPLKRLGWRATWVLALVTLVATLLIFAPLLLNYADALDKDSGFVAYADGWEMNDAFFMGAKGMLHQWAGIELELVTRLLRYGLAAGVAGLSLWFWTRDPKDLMTAGLVVAATLFLFSPTQFPWYYAWLFPFLVFRPVMPLIWLTALLPIYYWRFEAVNQNWTKVFDQQLVWLEFVPVVLGLAWIAWSYFNSFPKANDAKD